MLTTFIHYLTPGSLLDVDNYMKVVAGSGDPTRLAVVYCVVCLCRCFFFFLLFFFSVACFVVRDMICVEVGVDRIIILQRERETVPQPEGE